MPTYEYECKKCGHRFEHFQSITADPLKTCLKESCPQEGGRRGKVQRLIGTGGGLVYEGDSLLVSPLGDVLAHAHPLLFAGVAVVTRQVAGVCEDQGDLHGHDDAAELFGSHVVFL